jgi:hypothetical protein
MAVCCQNLPLGALSSRSAPSAGWRAILKVRSFFEQALYLPLYVLELLTVYA